MGYLISNTGHLSEVENDTTIENAIKNRIIELETFVKSGSELEIDYEGENNTWMAANYSEKNAESTPIMIDNRPVIAFTGMDYATVVHVLNKLDVYYVA